MESRIIIGLLLIIGVLTPGTTTGVGISPVRQWAIVGFVNPTQVSGKLLNSGQYLIAHDFEKMARGEPCTTFYRFGESGNGTQEQVVSFHCIPRERQVSGETLLTTTTVPGDTQGCTYGWSWKMDKLTEYQFAGDPEGHGVPDSEGAEHSHK